MTTTIKTHCDHCGAPAPADRYLAGWGTVWRDKSNPDNFFLYCPNCEEWVSDWLIDGLDEIRTLTGED